ncbi:MAG TPA: RnfABCDGE type electron transport complex subunit G [Gammaproteobacteria bacterium]|nr:RnfABCDGE type electron transport complex subunit G [Gammaproteobacteria bacterium]
MAEGKPLATVLLVAAIAAAAAVLVTASWEFSHERIAENQRARLLASLSSVLDERLLERDLDPVLITAEDEALLGSDEPIDVFVPVDGTEPLAAIFASIAPGGYNAPIYLLIGIDVGSGEVTGVRVVSHRETPGLGDLIDIEKSGWLLQFDGASVNDPAAVDWALTRDDGVFDSITGATVTPRAVVQAVHNTLLYFDAHRDELIARARREAESRGSASPE